jgi:MscS family membrane protein
MNTFFASEIHFLENPLREFFFCLGILLLGFLFKRFGATFLSKQSFRLFKRVSGNRKSDELVVLIRKPFEQLLTLIILYAAFCRLNFPNSWELAGADKIGIRWFIKTAWLIGIYVVCTHLFLRVADYVAHVVTHREESPVSGELAGFIKELSKVLIIILAIFAGLRYIFSVNITALVASLGIGGLAVALAAQDTLANLLGSFIIYLDKPFRAGDLIQSGDILGRVEHVGFRTTRIRTLDKSLLTVPNKKLIDGALNNITLSEARRVRFTIGLTYNSKSSQILNIIDGIKQILLLHEHISDDYTVRFSDFDSSSLSILVIYFVKSNDFDLMVKVKEEINIGIMHIVEKHGCSFAFPTQTIHLVQ